MQASQVFNYIGKDGVYSDLIKENKGNHKVFSAIDRMLSLTPEKCYPSCEYAKELCNNFAVFSRAKLPQFDRI